MKKWYAPLGFLAVGIALASVPWLKTVFGFPTFWLIFMYFIFFWIAQASSWTMLSGYSGYFSFGQGAFFGIGVYVMATMIDKYGASFLVALPVGGIFATLLGLGIGFVVFRLRLLKGELFALLTLAVDFVLAAVVRNNDAIDGGFGVRLGSVDAPDFLGDFSTMMYILALIIALLTVFASYSIYHSRFGLGLFSIRDDEEVAEGLGVPTFRFKMAILSISCFFIGLSGALHALQIGYITVEGTFSLRLPTLDLEQPILRAACYPSRALRLQFVAVNGGRRVGQDDEVLLLTKITADNKPLSLHPRVVPLTACSKYPFARPVEEEELESANQSRAPNF